MLRTAWQWLDERAGVRLLLDAFLERKLPRGVGWLHTLGSATFFLLALQVVTGVALSLYYVPTPDHAYESLKYITQTVPFGAFLRGLHRWGASFIVLAAVLHMVRIFFMGAYKYPRELTWAIGILLLGVILGLGFTGYLLPWDNRAYWATVVGTSIVESWPAIGGFATRILRVGTDVGIRTLIRFYNLHTFVLPAVLGWLTLAHLYLVIRQGIAAPPGRQAALPAGVRVSPSTSRALEVREAYRQEVEEKQRTGIPFYEALWKDGVVALALFTLLAAMALFLVIPTEKVADPSDVNYFPRPEWYFLFLYELLWYFKGPWMVVGTFVIPAALFAVLILVPWLDRRPERHPLRRPLATSVAAAAIGAAGYLTYLGATAPLPPGATAGTPPPAGTTVAATPEAGKRIYEAQGCSACHAIRGQGGAAGPDLSRVGRTRDIAWLARFTRDPEAVKSGSPMPAYKDLSEAELQAIAAYLAGLR
jgi:ubiquinol-cytochrome c reductase cytochrome b subunit